MSEYLVQFNNISKFFGKVIALKDVTMRLRKGEIIEEGTHSELCQLGGLYAQLAELQEKGLAKLWCQFLVISRCLIPDQ